MVTVPGPLNAPAGTLAVTVCVPNVAVTEPPAGPSDAFVCVNVGFVGGAGFEPPPPPPPPQPASKKPATARLARCLYLKRRYLMRKSNEHTHRNDTAGTGPGATSVT